LQEWLPPIALNDDQRLAGARVMLDECRRRRIMCRARRSSGWSHSVARCRTPGVAEHLAEDSIRQRRLLDASLAPQQART
jgi:hypothetical protein